MKKENIIFLIVIAIILFYVSNRAGLIYHTSTASTMLDKLEVVSIEIGKIFNDIYISLAIEDLLWGVYGLLAYSLLVIYMIFSHKNYMAGKEHGSARWGNSTDIAKLIDKKYDNNMLFTMTERMSLNTRKTMKNNNTCVIGGTGTGKTRFVVKPNLMQLHSSYIITDPKGSLISETGKMFEDAGYVIKTVNLIDFSLSMHYNPFEYIEKEEDILTLANLIVTNLKDKDEKKDFFVNSELALYQSFIAYIYYELPKEEQTFESFIAFANKMRAGGDEFKSDIDVIMEELEERKPDHLAVLQYKSYKEAALETQQSIIASINVRLAPFKLSAVQDLLCKDDLDLRSIGDRKTVLYIITDDTSPTFNFIAAFMYTQLFSILCHRADTTYSNLGSRLPVHVRCILDEFANIGQIPNFDKLIATIRSREISTTIILQNNSQLDVVYGREQARNIISNCDTTLFLGTGDYNTMKYISERVGKATIDHRGTSTRKGINGDFTVSDQIIGRELVTPGEVGLLKNDECILFIRGLPPFKSRKFKLETHRRYRQLSDYNSKNRFDINEYKNRLDKEIEELDNYIEELNNIEMLK